jgi:23S rRNA (cytidine1920-2'-O)/16S rRNA (cytidine1409-2'-O)-methyltransferase
VKARIDLLLVSRGLFDSRAKARAAIEAGLVTANGLPVAKPSEMVADDAELVATPAHPFVGRGALKLDHALTLWPITVQDRVVIDVGASTGGFTEVSLLRGAARVYAVDVGRGQLHAKLSADPRVVSLEGLDARLLGVAHIPEPIDLVVCDASFIGLAKVLPAALTLARPGADIVCLVKPQFEAGPKGVGKGGLVKDEAVRARVLAEVSAWLTRRGWTVRETATSPITGSDGNVEFLLWATKKAAP